MVKDRGPLLNGPYEEPAYHYATGGDGSLDYARSLAGRRIFAPDTPQIPLGQQPTGALFDLNDLAAEYRDHTVNLLRDEVRRWHESGYAGVKAARRRGDGDWLVILGFGFESDVENTNVTRKVGSFEVSKVRMHDDLMQEGLIKKDKKAASFVTIGEPDIGVVKIPEGTVVEIRGLDIYDPIRDEVKPRSAADIAYWMVDDDYNGTDFVARQIFFCGGDKDEFDKWKKGLSNLAAASTMKAAEKTLKVELDDEAFERVYGFRSHPIPITKGKRVAVRVVSQFGEESTKVLTLS